MLSKAECFQLYNFFLLICHLKWDAWLASCLCCRSGDKQVPILRLCMQMNDAEKTQNTTFVLISRWIHWQSEWNTFPVCQKLVMSNLHYENRNGPSWFLIFDPREMVCLRCLTVRRWGFFLQLLNYPANLHKRLHPVQMAECERTRWCISDLSVNSSLPGKRHWYVITTLIKFWSSNYVPGGNDSFKYSL